MRDLSVEDSAVGIVEEGQIVERERILCNHGPLGEGVGVLTA